VAAAQWPWWAAGLAGAFVMTRAERRALAPVAAWLATSALAVSAGGYFRPHYFMFLVPPVALLGVAGLAALARRLAGERHQAALTAFATLAAVAWPVGLHAPYFRARSPELVSRELYPYQPFAESVLAAEWIRRSSAEDETVFVYGSEPQILFHAGRRSASRYIILYPVYARAADAGQRQAEVVDELERAPPRIVVVVLNTASLGPEPLLPRLLETRLREVLARDYEPAAATVVGPEGLARLLEPRGAGDRRLVAETGERPSLLLFRRR
jgi:4-amino-4-deoxy-L-arabinose transferase-like glycosyltransferase